MCRILWQSYQTGAAHAVHLLLHGLTRTLYQYGADTGGRWGPGRAVRGQRALSSPAPCVLQDHLSPRQGQRGLRFSGRGGLRSSPRRNPFSAEAGSLSWEAVGFQEQPRRFLASYSPKVASGRSSTSGRSWGWRSSRRTHVFHLRSASSSPAGRLASARSYQVIAS